MTNDELEYDVATIRQLLLAAFTPEELRRFCLDRSDFYPVVDLFRLGQGLADMADVLIDYCDTRLLFPELLAEVKEHNPDQYARFIEPERPEYSIATIRQLLEAAFTPEGLRRFCRYRPEFRPVVWEFGPDQGLAGMVDVLIDYCDRRDLFSELLAGVKEHNPRQYARLIEPEPVDYDITTIRQLLEAAFTSEGLRRFCRDRPTFRPVVDRFDPDQGLADMADVLIAYCDTRFLFAELLAEVKEYNPNQYARFIEPERPEYSIATIRQLLEAAFTQEELRRFCRDRPEFRPVVKEFSSDQGLADMVSALIAYCDTRLLFPELLAEVKEYNPNQYARFIEPEPPDYDITTIRQLLEAAFTREELHRFCRDRPEFRPVVKEFSPGQGLAHMVSALIAYCDTRLLFAELLAEVKEYNPNQYARFIEPELPDDSIAAIRSTYRPPVSSAPPQLAPIAPVAQAQGTQVFLCYARQDGDTVGQLYEQLSDAGFKPWMDTRDILPGEKWEASIERAIRNSDFFLACLSPRSVSRRGYIQKEIKHALDVWQEMLMDDIYLIPVRIEHCDVPEMLRSIQWVNLYEQAGWDRLLKALHVGMERRTTEERGQTPPDYQSRPMPSSPREKEETERYVDFDLHITSNGQATAKSDQGEASATLSIKVPSAIQQSLPQIESNSADSQRLKDFGRALYDWLFPTPIHTHFKVTEAVARNQGANVRMRLRVEALEIASLPLEFMCPKVGGYLAVNPDTVLSRYLQLPLPLSSVRPRKGPLHMLAIVADVPNLPRLDPDEWEGILQAALANQLDDGQMTLRMVKRATRREIRTALLERKPHIVQFVGHGYHKSGMGHLALVDEHPGSIWSVDDEQFAGMFGGFDDHLGLICLAACESAASDDPQGFRGIAPKLVEQGVPAVMAMQYKVRIPVAKVFLEDFYTAVAARKPLDWATQFARSQVALQFGYDNRDFGTPVLYMRAQDGEVF